jgi:flagellar biosynthesis protein FlhB
MSEGSLSSQRRQELRDSGVFPRAKEVDTFFVVLGLYLGLRFTEKRFSVAHFQDFRPELFNEILALLLPIAFGAAAGAIISALIQSRFLVRYISGRKGEHHHFFEFSFFLAKLTLWGAIGYLLFLYLLPRSNLVLLEDLRGQLLIVLPWGLGALCILGIVARAFKGLLFNERYKMSNEELMAEARGFLR